MTGKPTRPSDKRPAEAPQPEGPAQMEQELSGAENEEGSTTFAQTNPTQAE